MTFADMNHGDVLDQFDFDTFLETAPVEHDFSIDAFANYDSIEAAAGDA